MSHSVFQRATLAQNLKSKVESIAVSPNGDRIFSGCADGSLLVFKSDFDAHAEEDSISIGDSAGARRELPRFHLVEQHKKWCGEKRAITCLAAIGEWGVTISVCDGYMYMHNLATLELLAKLRNTRSCNKFCIDTTRTHICVSMKHRLLILSWNGKELIETKELHTPSSARSLQWVGKTLCVGFRREYNLLSIETGLIIKEIRDTGKKEKPLVMLVDPVHAGDDPEVLISNDSDGIFMDYAGSLSRKADDVINWSSIPVDACCLHPYIVALVGGSIQVHNISTLQLAENVSLNGCKSLCVARLPYMVSANGAGAGGARPSLHTILIAGSSSLHAFYVLPLRNRLDQFLSTQQYEAALMLCEICGETAERRAEMTDEEFALELKGIHLRFAEYLFKQRKFSKAREQFYAAECDPRVVLALFGSLLPDGVDFSSYLNDESVTMAASVSSDMRNVIDKSAITNLLIPFLILVRRRKWSMGLEGGDPGEDQRTPVRREGQGVTVFLDEIVDTVLLKAYIFTNAPLADIVDFLMSGGALSGADNENVGFDVGLGVSSKESLFRDSYECRALVDESEDLLRSIAEKWEELVWFYFSRGLHQKALDWLQDAHLERNHDPYPSKHVRAEKTVEYLQRLLEVAAADQLRTQTPVSSRSHTRLVLEYSKWILSYEPSLGLRIFTAFVRSDPVAAIAINPANILKHMEQSQLPDPSKKDSRGAADKLDTTQKIRRGSSGVEPAWDNDEHFKSHPETCNELCVCYLECLLLELPRAVASKQRERSSSMNLGGRRGGNDLERRGGRRISIAPSRTLRLRVAIRSKEQTVMLQNRLRRVTSDESLHNQLALYYLEAIHETQAPTGQSTLGMAHASTQPPSTAKAISRENGRRGSLRRRLLSFLQTSKHYQAHTFLTKFQATRLYEERAVLLQRAGRHEDALKIYVHDMGALEMATAYCDRVSKQREGQNVDADVSKSRGTNSIRSRAQMNSGLRLSYTGEQDIYIMLLRTCLKQPAAQSAGQRLPGWAGGRNEAMLAPALRILKEHSTQIDPVQALSLLPPSTPVSDLHDYLKGVLREKTTRRRNNQVCKNLLKLEHLEAMKVSS